MKIRADEGKVRPILKSKVFLYITEFASGMAVMAAELGAQRLLAPYFSSSQVVWTIIIGTIMIALALGAVFGGRWADKNPDPDKLYMRVLIAGVWLALVPLVGKYIVMLVSGLLIVAVSTNFLVIAAFVSCIVIFVPPLFLLGTVTPGLNKFATDSLEDNASVVGRLSACNTIGSILGTFLPTFVTIPAVGTFITFLIFAGVLLLLPLVYFLSARVHRIACAVSVVLFVVSCVFSPMTGFAFWANRSTLAYEGESMYNYLQVQDLPDRTILSTNVLFGVQSVTMKNDGLTGMYYDTALAASALAEKQDSALILGMGTGTYARELRKYCPNMKVTGVEIDQKITQLAGKYFGEPADIDVATYDGRAWLAASHEKFDVIMVDAYQDITIPFQMSSREFFTMVRKHLAPGGVMVVNMNMISDGQGSINEALTDTIAAVFGSRNMVTADVPDTTNRELFAKNVESGTPTLEESLTEVREGTSSLDRVVRRVDPDFRDVSVAANGGTVLTDDKAPVELLGMHAIDGIIAQQAEPYREIVRTQGI